MSFMNLELVKCLRDARVRPIRSMREWFEQELIIPDGEYEGERWTWARQPVSRLLVDEIDSGQWTEIFVTGPSQSGKTLAGFVGPALYHVLELGEKDVLGIPDLRMADNKWQLDLLPVIKGNPRLSKLLPTKGPGSKEGQVKDTVTFQNGGLFKFMSAGGSDQARAGFTTRVISVTEAARFSKTSETSSEADPLRQLRARQASYDEPRRRLYVEGTVTVEQDLPYSAKSQSSDSILLSPCPHCGCWIAPERENLLGWQDAANLREAQQRAIWACPECGELIDDAQRRESVAQTKLVHAGQEINKNGAIVGPMPPTNRLWFRYSAWHNLFVSTSTLGGEEWTADQIDHESIEYELAQRELSQFKWATPFKALNLEAQKVEARDVLKRREERWPEGLVPHDATHLALGCDMGKYAAHWLLMAGRANGSLHVVTYGIIDIPTQHLELELAFAQSLGELFDMCELGWIQQGKDSQDLRKPDQVWIDAGYEPDSIYKAFRQRYSPARKGMVQLVIGRGSGQMQRIYAAPPKKGSGVIEIGHHWHVARNKRWRALEIFCDSDYWKDRLHDSIRQPKDKAGAITLYHAPERQHVRLSKHWTNEHRTVEFVPGKGEVVKWERKGHQHWFDAAYNARAALDRAGWQAKE